MNTQDRLIALAFVAMFLIFIFAVLVSANNRNYHKVQYLRGDNAALQQCIDGLVQHKEVAPECFEHRTSNSDNP